MFECCIEAVVCCCSFRYGTPLGKSDFAR